MSDYEAYKRRKAQRGSVPDPAPTAPVRAPAPERGGDRLPPLFDREDPPAQPTRGRRSAVVPTETVAPLGRPASGMPSERDVVAASAAAARPPAQSADRQANPAVPPVDPAAGAVASGPRRVRRDARSEPVAATTPAMPPIAASDPVENADVPDLPAAAAAPLVLQAPHTRRPAEQATASVHSSGSAWDRLAPVTLDRGWLERNRVISAGRETPAHVAFDVLRTRLLAALRENGWTRVAVTSPTKGCGKTFVAANLAISLSRHDSCRTVLMDMDLREPSLANVLGVRDPGLMADYLSGATRLEDHFRIIGPNDMNIGANIALGLNARAESYAAEQLQDPATGPVLGRMMAALDPDVVIYDLPPALFHDDVLAFRPNYDGVLLVVGGGITKPQEVREVKRRLGEDTPLLGVIMNKAEGLNISDYSY
jgi:Mrp family chromosome partitioning ATPase